MTRPEGVTAAQICDQGTNLDGCQAGALDRRSAMPLRKPSFAEVALLGLDDEELSSGGATGYCRFRINQRQRRLVGTARLPIGGRFRDGP